MPESYACKLHTITVRSKYIGSTASRVLTQVTHTGWQINQIGRLGVLTSGVQDWIAFYYIGKSISECITAKLYFPWKFA